MTNKHYQLIRNQPRIIDAKLMFKAKAHANEANELIKLINTEGLNYPDHGKAFLLDLRSFRGQFIILMQIIAYKLIVNGCFKDKDEITDYFKNIEYEFRSELRLIHKETGEDLNEL